MSCSTTVAHRAARQLRTILPIAIALMVAFVASATVATPAAAASYAPRVVIVVGPSHGSTAKYLERARSYAGQARAYGAAVTELYTPKATWARVVAASQGANIFIYLGHGNGWPSPYAPYQGTTKNGLGLNPYAGSGTSSPVKYYGEDQIAAKIRLAPGAVVLFNHLCYASGNGEPGSPEPSWSTARQRVDHYAAGFLRARAAAVIADGHTSLGQELAYLFGKSRSVLGAWRADPGAQGHERIFSSTRTPGYSVHLDPNNRNSGFYRSIVVKPRATTSGIRIAAWRGVATVDFVLRDRPSSAGRHVATGSDGQNVFVAGAASTDGAGRTWTPVITMKGQRGWIAGWLASWRGSAVPRVDLILRKSATTSSAKLTTLRAGSRVTIIKSARDSKFRAWVYVRTSSGRTGWLASWLMRP